VPDARRASPRWRTSLDTFARAWDGYTQATHGRLATERELRTLGSMLESSLGEEEGPGAGDLGRAIDEHRDARASRAEREAVAPRGDQPPAAEAGDAGTRRRAGDPDRSNELRLRPGWAWLRVFRRYDDYRTALAQVEQSEDDPTGRDERQLAASGRD
jgi:hypothetical protein